MKECVQQGGELANVILASNLARRSGRYIIAYIISLCGAKFIDNKKLHNEICRYLQI